MTLRADWPYAQSYDSEHSLKSAFGTFPTTSFTRESEEYMVFVPTSGSGIVHRSVLVYKKQVPQGSWFCIFYKHLGHVSGAVSFSKQSVVVTAADGSNEIKFDQF